MLFIDGQKIKARDFCTRFGIDYDKLVSRPSFEMDKRMHKKDRMNGGRISVPSGLLFRTKFHAVDKHGESVEIRYAQTSSPKTLKTGHVEIIYRPRYVGFTAVTASFKKDTDLAVFMFANPANKFSPLRTKYSPKPGYEFIDGQLRALDKMKSIEALTDALSHAKSLKGHELKVIAKGLKIRAVDENIEDSVRAALMEYAQKDPKGYLEVIAIGLVKLEGRIRSLVEKKVFVLHRQQNARWWEWGAGEREGEKIGNVINNTAQDAVQSLINYMNAHMDVYKDLIESMSSKYEAEDSAKEYLKKSEPVVEEVEAESPVDTELLAICGDHHGLIKFIQEKGYKAAPVALKGLKEAVAEGKVNSGNLEYYLQNSFNKQE